MSATFSPCRRWRYTLTRENLLHTGGGKGTVVWCGFNPSTADEEANDPTISREIGFTTRWGYSRLVKVNLAAWRSTDPKGLEAAPDALGEDNLATILREAREAALFVAAWGALPEACRVQVVRDMPFRLLRELAEVCDVYALGTTKDGAPIHPLARGKHRVPDTAHPVLWRPKRRAVLEHANEPKMWGRAP